MELSNVRAQRLLQRTDALRYLIDEIVTVAPRPGERESLRAEREILRNAEIILRHARAAYEALYEGEGAALSRLSESLRALRDLLRFDPSFRVNDQARF